MSRLRLWPRLGFRFRRRRRWWIRCRSSAARRQRLQQIRSIGTAPSGAGVPTRPGAEVAIVARGDIAKGAGTLAGLVERRVQKSYRLAQRLVQQRDQSRPQRRNRAGASNGKAGAVDGDVVAGRGIGVAGYIGHAAAFEAAGILAGRHAGARLIGRQREGAADAAAGRAVAARLVVPHNFARNRAAADLERRAAAGERVRAGGGKVDVVLAIAYAIVGADCSALL